MERPKVICHVEMPGLRSFRLFITYTFTVISRRCRKNSKVPLVLSARLIEKHSEFYSKTRDLTFWHDWTCWRIRVSNICQPQSGGSFGSEDHAPQSFFAFLKWARAREGRNRERSMMQTSQCESAGTSTSQSRARTLRRSTVDEVRDCG